MQGSQCRVPLPHPQLLEDGEVLDHPQSHRSSCARQSMQALRREGAAMITPMLACPFCGGSAIEVKPDAFKNYAAFCLICHVVGPYGSRPKDAMKRWNERRDAPEQTLTNDQCRRVVGELREHEWSGITNDDVRLWDSLIEQVRLKDRQTDPPRCEKCHGWHHPLTDCAPCAKCGYSKENHDNPDEFVPGVRHAD